MKFSRRLPHLRSLKFAPFAVIALFLLTNFSGVFATRALAPSAGAELREIATIPSDIPTSGNTELDWVIFRAGEREGVDPRFIHAVIWQESKYEVRAVSHAGAQGLMQLMPATARRFGCNDPNNISQNVGAGTKYLAWLLKRFEGDVKLALAGYNAGEGAVDKYKGIPPYDETENYVRKISASYGKTFHPVLTPAAARVAFNLSSPGVARSVE